MAGKGSPPAAVPSCSADGWMRGLGCPGDRPIPPSKPPSTSVTEPGSASNPSTSATLSVPASLLFKLTIFVMAACSLSPLFDAGDAGPLPLSVGGMSGVGRCTQKVALASTCVGGGKARLPIGREGRWVGWRDLRGVRSRSRALMDAGMLGGGSACRLLVRKGLVRPWGRMMSAEKGSSDSATGPALPGWDDNRPMLMLPGMDGQSGCERKRKDLGRRVEAKGVVGLLWLWSGEARWSPRSAAWWV